MMTESSIQRHVPSQMDVDAWTFIDDLLDEFDPDLDQSGSFDSESYELRNEDSSHTMR